MQVTKKNQPPNPTWIVKKKKSRIRLLQTKVTRSSLRNSGIEVPCYNPSTNIISVFIGYSRGKRHLIYLILSICDEESTLNRNHSLTSAAVLFSTSSLQKVFMVVANYVSVSQTLPRKRSTKSFSQVHIFVDFEA